MISLKVESDRHVLWAKVKIAASSSSLTQVLNTRDQCQCQSFERSWLIAFTFELFQHETFATTTKLNA